MPQRTLPLFRFIPLKGPKPMKKLSLAARTSLLAASVALLFPLAAQAQNITHVNGKPVPKARAEARCSGHQKGGQPAP